MPGAEVVSLQHLGVAILMASTYRTPSMKTTVDIPDVLLDRLRARAAKERTSMRDLIAAALHEFLGAGGRRAKPFILRDESWGSGGLQPGIREGDWRQVLDIVYEGRGGVGGGGS